MVTQVPGVGQGVQPLRVQRGQLWIALYINREMRRFSATYFQKNLKGNFIILVRDFNARSLENRDVT